MMLPLETGRQMNDSQSVTLYFTLPPTLFWFSGHFPVQAILPGVAQIDWVMHYASEVFQLRQAFKSMDVIKFQRPLFPNEQISLTLNWDPTLAKLSFIYACGDRQASNGRITLCP